MLRQGDCHEFSSSIGYIIGPCLRNRTKKRRRERREEGRKEKEKGRGGKDISDGSDIYSEMPLLSL